MTDKSPFWSCCTPLRHEMSMLTLTPPIGVTAMIEVGAGGNRQP
jgi:hypothetical protein